MKKGKVKEIDNNLYIESGTTDILIYPPHRLEAKKLIDKEVFFSLTYDIRQVSYCYEVIYYARINELL